MSVSTDGQLCFGIKFEEEFEFPWDGMELEEWWREVNDCPVENPYDERGEYKQGATDGDGELYFDQIHEWDVKNPVPIELVNYCSMGSPMWIVAVPSSCRSCSRGYPMEVYPHSLTITLQEERNLLHFCMRFGIEVPSIPSWYLSSYWER
jgi:hypothetical protein